MKERLLAQDKTTTSEFLIKLAQSEDKLTRKYVAVNPNTPITTLQKLGLEFPDEITRNPSFNLLLLESPDSKFVRLSLARSSTTKRETLEKLVELEDEDILCAIASNTNTPIPLLEKLADWNKPYYQDEEYLQTKVPRHVVVNRIITPEILDRLADCNDSYVRQIVAENNNTKPTTLEKLAQNNPKHILLKVGQNINTPISALERLAADKDKDIRDTILAHPYVSDMAIKITIFMEDKPGTCEDTFVKLAKDSRLYIKQMLAEHPLCPPKILKELANHNDYEVIYSISCHPNIKNYVLEQLSLKLVKYNKQNQSILKTERGHVNYQIIYLNLLNHPQNTLKAKLNLITLELYESTKQIARSPQIPSEVLDELAQQFLNKADKNYNRNQDYLITILNNPNTSTKTITKIFYQLDFNQKYNIYEYGSSIVNNPNTESHILEEMYQNRQFKHLDNQIAFHPNTTSTILRNLYDNHNNTSVVRNPNTPTDILLDIIDKYDWGTRRELAQFNNRIPDDILKILIDDDQVYVKAALASNSCLPISAIEHFAKSEIHLIKEGVSKNLKTPDYILDILANDSDINIRLNVAKHQNTLEQTLLTLVKDTDESIKAELSKRYPINLNIITILMEDIENHLIVDRDHRFTIMNQVAKYSEVSDYLLEKVASCILLDCMFSASGRLWQVESSLVLNPNTPISVLENIARDRRNYSDYLTIKRLALRNIKSK